MAKTSDDLSIDIRAPKEGVLFRRFFTTPNQDPMDDVEWEIRDARIGTGEKVAFEQTDVEFPLAWSQNATNIVAQKYFRGPMGTPQRERSVRQMIGRVVNWYTQKGSDDRYFGAEEDRAAFKDELTHLLVNQKMAFNSPVWFNVGLVDLPRVSACFILDVEDEMSSILNWYVEEGLIFKAGSGAGINLSKLRSSKEQLTSGGTASGPVSFMRGADASAGTIKSGGSTRRAAKMVVLDVEHPDIEEFIECKVQEERKARALREAGFDMDLDGKDSHSIQYQNANNSVGLSDEFLQTYVDDKDWDLKAVKDGRVLETVKARDLMRKIAEAAWECADPGVFYMGTLNSWHTSPAEGPIRATNPCAEFCRPANTSCNLASLRLTKFVDAAGEFQVDAFVSAVETTLTAMDISVTNAEYPTDKIKDMVSAYRELGLGYTDLGALLMDQGVAYDSEEGRAWAASITALMSGIAYRRSAEIAADLGPYSGWSKEGNAKAHLDVVQRHREAVDGIDESRALSNILTAAREAWDDALELGAKHGYRNAQVTLIAPTGCLVGGSLIPTERGLVRLASLGDPEGDQWQDLGIKVNTDHGAKTATKFYVNGVESVVDVRTARGYSIQGTTRHQIKVVDSGGDWEWKHLSDIRDDDLVPLALDPLIGEPQTVKLPPLSDAYWTGEHHVTVPETMTADLAEMVGYFMGDGSLHSRGIRLCVDSKDFDVAGHLTRLAKSLFKLETHIKEKQGYTELAFHSVRLVEWWRACGFAKLSPGDGHTGKGYLPRIPEAVLYSNDREVYAAFLRGLFEADGTVTLGNPDWTTTSFEFANDVQTLLLALGYPTTRRVGMTGFGGSKTARLRLLNRWYNRTWLEEIGFLSGRKRAKVICSQERQSGKKDRIPIGRSMVDRLVPEPGNLRRALLLELGRNQAVSRRLAERVYEETQDPELGFLLSFFYDTVASAKLGDEEFTYDLSVPDTVSYTANGFISHNTISFLMDADTTGIEPDLALVKTKKLVGGGTMKIVNQKVPSALKRLGYEPHEISEILAYISEHNSVKGAPFIKEEHHSVFDCAMGDSPIHYLGHMKMMAAVQPYLCGSISKTINLPENATVDDIESLYVQGWRMGLKNLAMYRDNCKVAQPLNADKKKKDEKPASEGSPTKTVRRRLPRKRNAKTMSFKIADCDGYVTAGEYPDTEELGEIFLKVAKQGSTLAGIMDAFAISVSVGLQSGVPLKTYVDKFINMRFEPSGVTDDPDFRFATSIVDYIFRRLASDYLTDEEKEAVNVKTTGERQASLDGGVPAKPNGHSNLEGDSKLIERVNADAPLCYTCGIKMQPAGSCFVCASCGATSGCS